MGPGEVNDVKPGSTEDLGGNWEKQYIEQNTIYIYIYIYIYILYNLMETQTRLICHQMWIMLYRSE